MQRKGFTIVEVMIVMVIMVILLTLAVVNMRSTQVNARDKERRTDVEAIARQLDTLYLKGVSYTTSDTTTTVNIRGSYPSTGDLFTGVSDEQEIDMDVANELFGDLPAGVLISPLDESPTESFKAATSNNTDPYGVAPGPGLDFPYVYQPLQRDGTLCELEGAECSSFNIFYHLEVDDSRNKLSGQRR